MSDSEEEIYSTMFTSLRHPARRKILRMLSGGPRSFSEMLEQLGISSSHLTYHLESLAELVCKMEDGRYRLSTFGEAAVATMSTVEEAPKPAEPRRAISPRSRVPTSWVVLVIGIVVLASVCLVQYRFLNQLSADYEQLKAEHDTQYQSLSQLSSEYEQLITKYEILVEGRSLDPWECTSENLAKLKDIKQQAVPDLERLKDQGIPISDVYIGVDKTGKWIKLLVFMRYVGLQDKVKLMDTFGWDVPVAFHDRIEEAVESIGLLDP